MTTWIRCETRDQLRVVIKYFKSKGWKWFDGKDPKPKKESKKYFKKQFRISFDETFGYMHDTNCPVGDNLISFEDWYDLEAMKTGFEKLYGGIISQLGWQPLKDLKFEDKSQVHPPTQSEVDEIKKIWNSTTTDKVSDESGKNPQSKREEILDEVVKKILEDPKVLVTQIELEPAIKSPYQLVEPLQYLTIRLINSGEHIKI